MNESGDDWEHGFGLTLAGVLLCSREPQEWLPHAYVQAVSYAGERTDLNYQTDARDIVGPLDEQVAEALHFVRRNMLVRATKGTGRVERPRPHHCHRRLVAEYLKQHWGNVEITHLW